MKPVPLLLALLSVPAVAFDFTPRVMETTFMDGRVYIAEYFQNNGIFYRPSLDGSMMLSGGAGKATLIFSNLQGADIRLETSPLKPEVAFAEENTQRYEEVAAAYAPAGGSRVEGKGEAFEAFSQQEKTAYAVTSTYQLPGGVVRQQVVFINFLPEDQIVMVTTAYEQDADAAFAKAVNFLQTLHEVPEESLKAPVAF